MKLNRILVVVMIASLLVFVACSNDNSNNNNDDVNNGNNGNDNNNNNNDGNNDNNENNYGFLEFNECLANNGIVIFGSEWCPACRSLVELLGGSSAVEPVYVECTKEQDRCAQEKMTGYVPEIHFNGEVYEGQRSVAALAQVTGCDVPV